MINFDYRLLKNQSKPFKIMITLDFQTLKKQVLSFYVTENYLHFMNRTDFFDVQN